MMKLKPAERQRLKLARLDDIRAGDIFRVGDKYREIVEVDYFIDYHEPQPYWIHWRYLHSQRRYRCMPWLFKRAIRQELSK